MAATRRARKSCGSNTTDVVPSRQGFFKSSCNLPSGNSCKRSHPFGCHEARCDSAGRIR